MQINYKAFWEKEALIYSEYRKLMLHQSETGLTSGPNQSEAMVKYTALNEKRMQRLERKLELSDSVLAILSTNEQKQNWLVITETWCGDAAQSLPVIHKMAEANSHIQLRTIWRDEYPEVMNAHLTNGSKSIPKLIVMNEGFEVIGEWGPRPSAAQQLVMDGKEALKQIADADEQDTRKTQNQIALQKWYNADKGNQVAQEILKCTIQ